MILVVIGAVALIVAGWVVALVLFKAGETSDPPRTFPRQRPRRAEERPISSALPLDSVVIWELIFMLVILKIPVVYLCAVVWWAIRAETTAARGRRPAGACLARRLLSAGGGLSGLVCSAAARRHAAAVPAGPSGSRPPTLEVRV